MENGMMEYWSIGMMELGNEVVSQPQYSILPLFQHSSPHLH